MTEQEAAARRGELARMIERRIKWARAQGVSRSLIAKMLREFAEALDTVESITSRLYPSAYGDREEESK